jgi:menaquinone-9 beta-reductase
VTRRATLRGAERTQLDERADVLICGASFAGLAVARELAGSGADVLVVDRYEIGERATSACAAPTPWLHAMGVERSIRQELECMAFHTPHGSARFRLPWSWSSFDYRELCAALWEQADARFEIATARRRDGEVVATDRGTLTAPLIVDALGWRRVLGAGANVQPPEARISRGLEVHPHDSRGTDLDVWIDRSVVRYGYAWSVPAGGERRIGVGSYEPRHHVKEPTREMARRLDAEPVRYQGNWFPHELRPATEDGVFFVGDSAGHCIPLSGEGIRTAFYFGIAAGREIRAALAGKPREQALAAYAAFSDAHAPFFRTALRLQRLIPALPPRALTVLLAALGRERPCRRAFTWYLDQAPPRIARPDGDPLRRERARAVRDPGLGVRRGAHAGLHERGGARPHA